MKINKDNIPIVMQSADSIMRNIEGYGGMTIAYNELPKGTDFSPLLEGLKNNSCHCPHWGYIVKGQMTLHYDNGEDEVVKAGDVFYAPAGHTGKIDEDIAVIEFSPEKEYMEVMTHIGKKMQAMG